MSTAITTILTVPFWHASATAAAAAICARAAKQKAPIQVVTLNAEMAVFASDTDAAAAAILSADFFVADSIAVVLACRTAGRAATRIPGIDLASLLTASTSTTPTRVALVGGLSDVVRERAKKSIEARGSIVVYATQGPPNIILENSQFEPWFHEIAAAQPDLILLALGHGKQEWWGSELKKVLNFSTIIIGVGGTLDVWGGASRRAPRFMRAIGIEWLWRLLTEPRRLRRIITATVVFPFRVLRGYLV
ncbi:MAG: hypothetical protein A2848_00725 [Candidatus Magasanikbacteria bacterium RIFCSPHIGHO2_01_FULL_50_8]|uniref:Glycosyltransferase n=2 Tax=Candidatus Magasanikiibacteriota TaxID=1752731 RepID=A0A1F6LNJ7_9BACT|nr:MAG: hypothetical protein A2848_00725 [Candidatus Magasanikbacteria bacterium RIFCSPHIGHO2_01_FULL_50_8]OGH68148.1 MAG: hypothetical protein A3C15_03560 [Candidatus Magasanikbacteria bacterium RIFCSPHIGHO2_02_FULL_50_9b]